jgi:hypothetical protein
MTGNAWADVSRQIEAEIRERSAAEEKENARLKRRIERVERWAKTLNDEERMEWLTFAAVRGMQWRSLAKHLAMNVEVTRHAVEWNRVVEREWAKALSVNARAKLQPKEAADARWANDPKRAAKEQALQQWKDWQAGKSRHASNAAFARHIVETTVITDTGTVQRWIREWRKG